MSRSQATLTTLIGALCLALAGSAGAQMVSPMHIIPVIAKAQGEAGTDWQSDLAVSNVSAVAVTVRAAFFREATNNQFLYDFPVNVNVQPGETLMVADVLGTWFPSQGNNTKGVLFLLGEPAGGGSEDEVLLAVSSRTYNNADPNATYGQTVGSGLFNLVFGQGTSVLPGVRHDDRFRSNVGVVNLSPLAATLLVTTYDTTGAQRAQVTKTVESFSLRQWSLDSLGVSSLGGGRVEVEIDPATITWDPCDPQYVPGLAPGLFLAYLSKVDQATGDAEFGLGQVDWTGYAEECGEVPDDCP